MKNRMITALAGAAVIMAAVTGCSSQKDAQTEAQSLVISDIDVVDETGTGDSEGAGAENETEAISIDLSGEAGDSGAELSEAETGTADGELQLDVKQKPGEDETESAGTETSAEEESEEQDKADTKKDGSAKTAGKKKDTPSEKTNEKKEDETESLAAASSETNASAQTEKTPETGAPAQTESGSETGAPLQTEKTPETGAPAQTESESETGAPAQTENAAESDAPEQADEWEELPALVFANDRVNVRGTASTDGEIKALIPYGSRVLALETEGDWMLVRYEAEEGFAEGYMKKEFLTDSDSLYTAKEIINVRAEADTDSEKLGEIEGGEIVPMIELRNGWAKIRYAVDDELEDAYVKSEFLEKSEESLDAEMERLMEAAVETGTEEQTESETEKQTETMTEEQTESETETVTEEQTESETEVQTETATEEQTESETETATEEQTAQEAQGVELSAGVRGQFELARALYPDMAVAGLIYSSGNKEAEAQIKEYSELASEFGMELQTVEIAEEIDIDLAAAELAGSTNGIFCIDDELVNGLVATIRAYADETEIPVIGILETQVEQGCVAAWKDGVLYWNTEEAGKLGVDRQAIQAETVKEY